ncbi:hypothetical protein HK100_002344 [Physocladia obscura]|uniref:Uncharacterized protein n=1 Tax=Physocladia obscura TaxID=109957 RepID=A0AAD5T1I3_9FUNG|nr:hypothetical protein HK100_002344 [Physocladia obscura]
MTLSRIKSQISLYPLELDAELAIHESLFKHNTMNGEIDFFDPSDGENRALIWASFRGNLQAVKLLLTDNRVKSKLKLCKPNFALYLAVENGHIDTVARI